MGLRKTNLFVLLFVFCLLYVVSAKSRGREREKKIDTRKATRLIGFQNKLSIDRGSGQVSFPDEMEFDFIVEGEPSVRSRSRKLPGRRSIPTFDSSKREHKRDRTNQQLYIDETGSYQVSATARSDGSVDSDLKALYKTDKGEKCFFARGESNCWKIDGKGTFTAGSLESDFIEVPSSQTKETRQKRQLVYSDFNPSRILKVVYVVDRQFMEWFRSISPDDTTAVLDAEDYILMLNNEMNYMFRGIKEISEADDAIPDMDITVYAQGFYYPALGTEWRWLRPYINRTTNTIDLYSNNDGALQRFGLWVGAGNVDKSGPFDTAALITPRLVSSNGNRILGQAFIRTVCDPYSSNRRVSASADKYYDVARILAHELGHVIGARHDFTAECPSYTNIMSGLYYVTPEKRNAWTRWSTCSVREIIAHVSRFPDCLRDEGFSNEDFYDQLCMGVRGGDSRFDINYQCKAVFEIESAVVCSPSETVSSGKVPAQACWDDRLTQCTNASGICSYRPLTIYDGTPCIGSAPTKDYVCYRGDCLEKVDVCAGRPTAAPPVCSCAILKGPLRTQCCRANRNSDDSCCYGCKPNTRNTSCISDWLI